MDNFLFVKSVVEENNCILLTTFEDFEKMRENVLNRSYNFVRIDITASCSHKTSVVFTNFKLRKTGIKCKDCIKKSSKNMVKDIKHNIIEYNSIKIISNLLNNKYKIIRLNEGCKSDIAIKKLSNEEDIWIPIQVKSTNKMSHSMYSFSFNKKNYDDILIILVCIEEEKLWIIPGNEIKNKVKLNISSVSKYNSYLVKDNLKISLFIDKFLDKIKQDNLCNFNIPISIYQKREQEYVLKREKYINLEYKYPEIQGTVFDFYIGDKKIQEKVLGIRDNKLICNLSHNGKKIDGKRNTIPYNNGDNDYYWFHSSIDNRFWIIPENELIHNK